MALSASTIATAVKALAIAGVTIRDLSDIHPIVYDRDCPILMPDPDNWGGEMTASQQTFGGAASRYWNATRTLGYIYWHAQLGSNRHIYELISSMSDKRDLIIEALCELDVAGVDVVGVASSPFQKFQDAGGTHSFHGFSLSVIVTERMNA